MRYSITPKKLVRAASVFFGVLYLFMTTLFVLNNGSMTGKFGGHTWWWVYFTFLFSALISSFVSIYMVEKEPSEEDHG